MAADRYYVGKVEAAGATGTMEFVPMGADGWHENAFGQRIENAVPTEAIDIAGFTKLGLIAQVTGQDGEANLAVEVNLNGLWAKVADVTAGEALILTDLCFAQLRVVWTGGAESPDIDVALAIGC